MLTREKIVAFTKAMARRVLANETGVAPVGEKQVERLEELKDLLKAAQRVEQQVLDKEEARPAAVRERRRGSRFGVADGR